MKEYVKEITDSLQANTTLQSLTLFGIGKIGVESIKMVLMNKFTINKLRLSWERIYNEDREFIILHTFFSPDTNDVTTQNTGTANETNRVVDVNILYDNQFGIIAQTKSMVNLSHRQINDDAVHVLAFGLCNNTTVEQLNISHNQITAEGVITIIDCLKHNTTLKHLDLSFNYRVTFEMNRISEKIENLGTTLSLEYINLNNWLLSPWGVYCAIIRHCCVNSLTLCGDEGMKEYVKEITDS